VLPPKAQSTAVGGCTKEQPKSVRRAADKATQAKKIGLESTLVPFVLKTDFGFSLRNLRIKDFLGVLPV
jgi:hypothetical protein